MTAPNLNSFLSAFAYPILKEAGYERKGREFRLVGPRGRQAYLGFYPDILHDSVGFVASYGVTTLLHRKWLESAGIFGRPWLGPSETLLRVQEYAPEWVDKNTTPDVNAYRWSYSDEQSTASIGAILAARLREQILPRLSSWFDAHRLAEAALGGDYSWIRRFMPAELTAAVALAEEGPSNRIDELLAQAADRDRAGLGDWIKTQVLVDAYPRTREADTSQSATTPLGPEKAIQSLSALDYPSRTKSPRSDVTVANEVLTTGAPWPEEWGKGRSTDQYFLVTPGDSPLVMKAVLVAASRMWCIDDQGHETSAQDAHGDLGHETPGYVAVHQTSIGLYLFVDTEGEVSALQAEAMLAALVQELGSCGVATRIGVPPASLEVGERLGP